ncbi:hypothetical protein [Photorhabdus heterorhabditis]|uniref:hypothetical protein n=1 Tax=Photorhabdus heterorhabditis TaxID=880156 RepID=UPI001561B9E7|nr:hypothetical protein [Photorhabdus heterorhabditis]NRN29584.1 hypothetical protein [Photorhabdus heterorhabditis subsp. aluminescens]
MLHRVCGFIIWNIPVILQVASLLAALTHPGHIVLYDIVIYDIVIYDIVIYAPGDSLPCRRAAI